MLFNCMLPQLGDTFEVTRPERIYAWGNPKDERIIEPGTICLIVAEDLFEDGKFQYTIMTSEGWPFFYGKNFINNLTFNEECDCGECDL